MPVRNELTQEQKLIADTFEEYCRTRITPNQGRWAGEKKFPRSVMKDLSEMVLGAMFGEGSEKMDEVTLGLISELMGKYEFPVPAFLTMHFAKLLPFIADKETRSRHIERYLNGDLVICGAFTEPGHGSDSSSITTTADPHGDEFAVNGEKAFVSSPGNADVHVVSVRTAKTPAEKQHAGISLLLVDGTAKGVEAYEMENMASVFRGDFGGIRFSDVTVPAGNIIGEINRGFYLLMKILNIQRVHVALYSIGLAEASLDDAISYAGIRKTFGQSISRHQAVSFRLAEDWTKIEASRLLAFNALRMQDNGEENGAQCASVKWYGCESAFNTVSDCMQTFGAAGYVKSSPIERRFRAARGFLIGDGTPDIQKLIISRKLFGRENAP